jgi:hypothetical protein
MNWAMVVQNIPDANSVVTVCRGSGTLAEYDVPFTETSSTEGLLIGTVRPVHVLLPSEERCPATRIRVTAGSCHFFAAILEGKVNSGNRPLAGDYNRFDWRTLTIGHRGHERLSEVNHGPRAGSTAPPSR